ncbi:MAG: DMT family transporter [Gammaproteobacteria bacterium]|nr:DMT family transporter [Gammaproteobacteria bacterium]
MTRSSWMLYLTTVLIWGSTWYAITFQLGEVAPAVSVAYRFLIASGLLLAWCGVRGLRLRFSLREHGFMALLGLCLFSTNYVLVYFATVHLASGLVAVTFSTIVLFNVFNGALLFRTPLEAPVLAGGLVGLLGICLLFWPEVRTFSLDSSGLLGLGLALAATAVASLGNMVATRNQRAGMPVLPQNAYGMGYGGLLVAAWVVLNGQAFTFEASAGYVLSLVYLAVFGSIFAFGAYLTLLGRIGASRASYASVLFPAVALAISTVFENYHWNWVAAAGLVLVMVGNALALGRPAAGKRLPVKAAG